MRARGQFLATLLVVVLVVAAGVYLERQVGPKALAAPVGGSATSGAWLCPHGGGPAGTKNWNATLAVANPGESAVRVRVTQLGADKPEAPEASMVPPGRQLLLDVPADSPEASTFVEYFGGWVSAGWVMRASGTISGVAAEPCAPEADTTWTLADGDTSLPQGAKPEEGNDTDLVIMNPFATDAALSVVLYANQRPTTTKELTDFVLPAMRSVSIPLAKYVVGPEAIGAQVRVSVGRVAAATLSTSFSNGIRSAEGVPGPPPQRIFLPAGTGHASTTQIAITAPAAQPVDVSGTLRGRQPQPVADLDQQQQQGGTSSAHDSSIQGAATYQITSSGGVAAAVRTLASDVSHDRAATSGSPVAAPAWVVPPAAASEPASSSILLLDAGTQDARVTLTALPSGKEKAPKPVTVTVPAGASAAAPGRFVSATRTSSVLAVSSGPPIVAASTAFSGGEHGVGGFAVSTGVVDAADGNKI